MRNLSELIRSKDQHAKTFAERLLPYLTTTEALHNFEMYAHMVRERAEYQTLQRILKSQGFDDATG